MKLDVRIFTGRLILTMDDEFHDVELFRKDKKLKKGMGYIKDSLVYIYRGKMDKNKKSDLDPGIYLTREGEYIFIEPSKEIKDKYSLDNVIELNIDKIFEEVEKHHSDFINSEDIEIINNNSEIYIPTIKEDDDFLKYIVKKIIIDKKINLKNYKDKFANQYALNNMKSGLNKETKMTVPNFKVWCEILGVDWEMIVRDNGKDKNNPLPEEIRIESKDF